MGGARKTVARKDKWIYSNWIFPTEKTARFAKWLNWMSNWFRTFSYLIVHYGLHSASIDGKFNRNSWIKIYAYRRCQPVDLINFIRNRVEFNLCGDSWLGFFSFFHFAAARWEGYLLSHRPIKLDALEMGPRLSRCLPSSIPVIESKIISRSRVFPNKIFPSVWQIQILLKSFGKLYFCFVPLPHKK